MRLPNLPVTSVLPQLRAALTDNPVVVLEAPPGSGKTTRAPLDLLGWLGLGGGSIVMTEPRRLAARSAATYIARLRGEPVGQTVGYSVRMESKVSRATRLEVVTDGLLVRRIQDDPELQGIGLLVFDEYHERSLTADLALALALDVQAALRPDLRLLLMSATPDARAAHWLGAPVVQSQGRTFAVETRRLLPSDVPPDARTPIDRLERLVPQAIRRALEETDGDVLAFLPGVREIDRVRERLTGLPDADVLPLHGSLSLSDQDAALAPSTVGRRKVVVASAIAETSLTLPGIRAVVDGGFARVPRYDAGAGRTNLATVAHSRASADQRAGRAGRVAPGVCYQLWTSAEHDRRPDQQAPEMQHADLAPLALELAAWGAAASDLRWLDAPPQRTLDAAYDLLRGLGAADSAGRVTPHGRALVRLGLHPRLGHLLTKGAELGYARAAADLAALLSERDLLRGSGGPPPPDARLRLDAMAGKNVPGPPPSRGAIHRTQQLARDLLRRVDGGREASGPAPVGLLVALAFPDRIAQPDGATEWGDVRVRLATGQRARLDKGSPLADAEFVAVATLQGEGERLRVALAAPLSPDELETHFAGQTTTEDVVAYDSDADRVIAQSRRTLGALVLSSKPSRPDPARIGAALMEAVRARGLHVLTWSKDAGRLRERLAFLRHHQGDTWPDVSDDALLAGLDAWLLPHAPTAKRLSDLARVDLAEPLMSLAGWQNRSALDRLAPERIVVPTGSAIALDYSDPDAPVLAVKLQELFGQLTTPTVLSGEVPVLMHLLSPARRPVQVTSDLAGFWTGSYHDVRKDLRGRYPKHPWPLDPLTAEPTRRTKRRG